VHRNKLFDEADPFPKELGDSRTPSKNNNSSQTRGKIIWGPERMVKKFSWELSLLEKKGALLRRGVQLVVDRVTVKKIWQ